MYQVAEIKNLPMAKAQRRLSEQLVARSENLEPKSRARTRQYKGGSRT
jgi:hypothetical protein